LIGATKDESASAPRLEALTEFEDVAAMRMQEIGDGRNQSFSLWAVDQ